MSQRNEYVAATFLSVAMLFTSAAQPMEIRQFDSMAVRDQGDYIQALIDGAQKVLKETGRGNLAVKVEQLFTELHHGDTMPLGMIEFENNLALLRLNDATEAAKDPTAPRLEAEDAMAVTLKKNGIDVPDSFFIVASGFKPKFPPQKN